MVNAMIVQLLLLLLGLVLLIKGADWLVSGSAALAKRNHVSDLAIGLTIVAFGTSAPELVVNTLASYQNHSEIVFGNVIGSNNFNLFIILGITGLIAPLVVQSSTVWREIPLSFFAVVLLYFLANDILNIDSGVLSRMDGIVLLMAFALFLYYVYKQLKVDVNPKATPQKEINILKIWILIVVGLAGLIIGGRLVITNAVTLATTFGVSEKIIGLTIVAAGTSLPELTTSVVAAIRNNNDIAVGNIIGSNIFNVFLILGVSSLVHPVTFDTFFNIDFYILSAGTLFLFIAMFTGKKKKLDRWEAGLLLLFYLGYTVYLIQQEL